MNRKLEPSPRELKELILPHKVLLEFVTSLGHGLIIAIGILKGGTGKSTTTLYAALWWAWKCGLKVCVVDTDENSQSLTTWYEMHKAMGDEIPFTLVEFDVSKAAQGRGPRLEDKLRELRREFDIVLVDLGGGDRETFGDACELAQVLLMPIAPSGWESSRLEATRVIANKHARLNETDLIATVILVKCSFKSSLPQETRYTLEHPIEGDPFPLPHPYFDISQAPHHVRSWETMPRRSSELEEIGILMRHVMKDVMEMMLEEAA